MGQYERVCVYTSVCVRVSGASDVHLQRVHAYSHKAVAIAPDGRAFPCAAELQTVTQGSLSSAHPSAQSTAGTRA